MVARDTDGHKVPRIFASRAEKKKNIQEKEVKMQELLSKTRRMTDLIKVAYVQRPFQIQNARLMW
jgi:hypothetical protein